MTSLPQELAFVRWCDACFWCCACPTVVFFSLTNNVSALIIFISTNTYATEVLNTRSFSPYIRLNDHVFNTSIAYVFVEIKINKAGTSFVSVKNTTFGQAQHQKQASHHQTNASSYCSDVIRSARNQFDGWKGLTLWFMMTDQERCNRRYTSQEEGLVSP